MGGFSIQGGENEIKFEVRNRQTVQNSLPFVGNKATSPNKNTFPRATCSRKNLVEWNPTLSPTIGTGKTKWKLVQGFLKLACLR